MKTTLADFFDRVHLAARLLTNTLTKGTAYDIINRCESCTGHLAIAFLDVSAAAATARQLHPDRADIAAQIPLAAIDIATLCQLQGEDYDLATALAANERQAVQETVSWAVKLANIDLKNVQ